MKQHYCIYAFVVSMMVSLIEGGATINDAAFSAATDIFNDSAVALEDTSGLSTVDGAPSKKRNPLLGGEASLLGVEIEEKGVQAILEALADEEKKEMTDTTMPIRHFRAEKHHDNAVWGLSGAGRF